MGLAEVNNLVANVKSKVRPYRNTLVADSGAIRNEQMLQAFYAMCEQNEIGSSIQAAFIAGAGAKFNAGNFSKLYSIYGSNDAVQATALNQPYLGGNIAPNERYAILNPNGGVRYVTHPALAYLSTDSWSFTTVVNWNGENSSDSAQGQLAYSSAGQTNIIAVRRNGTNRFTVYIGGAFNTGTSFNVYGLVGRAAIIHVVYTGSSIFIYVNGILAETIACTGAFSFSNLSTNGLVYFAGKRYAHIIRSGALTASQVLAEATFFRSLYPEIPNVQIGSQYWATSNLDVVCTPQGNVFPEITDNANVQVNSATADQDFSSDTGWWTKGTGVTIGGGVCHFATGAGVNGLSKSAVMTPNKYYKVTVTISNYVSGTLKYDDNISGVTIGSANGTFTKFIKGTNTGLQLYTSAAGTFDIDDISIQLVGWSGLSEVYDYVYAQTSGTTIQKDQAGCLAASAWCHYNNDPANGAIYGKLYNWYAARTLQYDIDDFNTANPTTPWGWKVPAQADFTTLQTTLGGSTVAGGKMKKEGLTYWLTPNTGADNSSGFSSVPTGYRISTTGTFGSQVGIANFWTSAFITLYGYYSALSYNDAALGSTSDYKTRGSSIRLIKG